MSDGVLFVTDNKPVTFVVIDNMSMLLEVQRVILSIYRNAILETSHRRCMQQKSRRKNTDVIRCDKETIQSVLQTKWVSGSCSETV